MIARARRLPRALRNRPGLPRLDQMREAWTTYGGQVSLAALQDVQ